jgi:hypothetical protein
VGQPSCYLTKGIDFTFERYYFLKYQISQTATMASEKHIEQALEQVSVSLSAVSTTTTQHDIHTLSSAVFVPKDTAANEAVHSVELLSVSLAGAVPGDDKTKHLNKLESGTPPPGISGLANSGQSNTYYDPRPFLL